MRLVTLTIACVLLTSCAALHSDDPASLRFNIPKDSILALNKSLMIAESDTHASIQYGKLVNDNAINYYEINCRLDFRAFGPREIKPENFTITRVEDGTNWISQPAILRFYTELHLASANNTDVITMECQTYGNPTDNHFTVAEMQSALGDFVTVQFAKKE